AVPGQRTAQARGRQRADAAGRQPRDGSHVYRESAQRGGNLAALLDPSADRGANPSARADGFVGTGRTRVTVAAMEEQDDKRGFKVQDRRRFSSEGEAKEGGDTPAESSEALDIKSKAAAPPETGTGPQAAASQPAASPQSS